MNDKDFTHYFSENIRDIPNRLADSFRFESVLVERDVLPYPWVKSLLERCSNAKIIEVADIRQVMEEQFEEPYPADSYGFRHLLVGRQRGPFVKPCPCSPDTMRCGYHFINAGLGCAVDCSYCILQGFLNTSFPVLYVNFDDMERELAALEKESASRGHAIRMGTGEMTDSLVFEPLTRYGQYLANLFSRFPHLILELKTKTDFIDNLLDIAVPNVVLAWSLNPDSVAQIEEPFAATPKSRLEAAKRSCQAGYNVGFHFDPIIACPGWETLYFQILESLFQKIPAEKIAWISLGTFRIFPALRDIIRKRHPRTQTILAEMVNGYDGKLRYFKKDRVAIYRQMRRWIEQLGGAIVPVYLCMESKDVWDEVVKGFDKKIL